MRTRSPSTLTICEADARLARVPACPPSTSAQRSVRRSSSFLPIHLSTPAAYPPLTNISLTPHACPQVEKVQKNGADTVRITYEGKWLPYDFHC